MGCTRPVGVSSNDLRDQLSELPLERLVALLSGDGFWTTEALAEFDLPSVTLTDGPHGLRRQPDDADHLGIGDSVPATCFPTASNLAASWDPMLLERIGAALGRECRADGVALLLGPGMNIKRHPGGGRNFEYLSEDPVLSGHLAAGMVRGIQSEGVGACLKHYVANNHESYRMVCDVIVDERTLRELYLRGLRDRRHRVRSLGGDDVLQPRQRGVRRRQRTPPERHSAGRVGVRRDGRHRLGRDEQPSGGHPRRCRPRDAVERWGIRPAR